MIVKFEDFKNEAKIPDLYPEIGGNDVVNEATQDNVQSFINKYEPVYLLQFFGSKSAVEDIENYNDLPDNQKTDEKKNKLLEVFKTTIAYFVAFYYFRERTVFNTGVGAAILKGENSVNTNNVQRSVLLWNQMVDLTTIAHIEYFDKYFCVDSSIFKHINSWGI